MKKKPEERIGATEGAVEIRRHPFFRGVDFDEILNRKIAAPIKPKVKDKTDVSYFDDCFTTEDPRQSLDPEENPQDLEKYNKDFDDFYFEQPNA